MHVKGRRQPVHGPKATCPHLLLGLACTWASLALPPLSFSFIGATSEPKMPAARYRAHRQRRQTQTTTAAVGKLTETEAKAKLLDMLNDPAVIEEVLRPEGKPTKGRLDEAIVALERLNSCEEPVYSELLDGTWKVKYSGSFAPGLLSSPTRELALFLYGGGFSLGNALSSFAGGFWGQTLGVKLGSKTVRITAGRDVDATAELQVAGMMQKLSYTAELMPLSSKRMSEEVVAVNLPAPLGKQELMTELRRSILVTYLDKEVMVVRDESGVPDVLMREDAWQVESKPASSVQETVSNGSEDVAGEDPLSSGAS